MSKGSDIHRASPGSLSGEVLSDLRVYREFLADRERAMLGLYGKRLPRSQVRDDLIRAVLVQFGAGQTHNISFYQRTLAHVGSQTAVRMEMSRLVDLGLLLVEAGDGDRRAALVVPTQRLVDWYCTQMPRLYDEVRRFLSLREFQPR